MKKRIWLYLVMTFALSVLSGAIYNKSYAEELPTSEELKNRWYDTHYYPIYMGNEFWQKYDMFVFLDIENPPLDLLFTMPSDELAELMMSYPCLTQVDSYWGEDGEREYDTFFAFCESNSDIFYELLRRDDGITALLNAYRNSDVSVEWLDDNEQIFSSHEGYYKWCAEVAGSQFITHYAQYFSPEECELANTIIDEKNEIYSQLSYNEYFNMSHIEVNEDYVEEKVRANYLSEKKIEKKEKIFADALEKMQSEEIEKASETEISEETPVDTEPVSETSASVSTTTDAPAEEVEKPNAYIIIATAAGIIVVFAVFALLVRKKKNNEQ